MTDLLRGIEDLPVEGRAPLDGIGDSPVEDRGSRDEIEDSPAEKDIPASGTMDETLDSPA